MKIGYKLIIFIIVAIMILNIFQIISNADMGAKPSINIQLKNMHTTNYLIDLLVYDETGEAYESEIGCNNMDERREPTDKEVKTLYEINYDGWISESTRWSQYLLMSDIIGNIKHTHRFSYLGTPDTYRVVIVYDSGEIKVSDIINRTEFTSSIVLDVNSMKLVKGTSIFIFIEIIKCIIVTILVELIIAFIFRINKELKIRNIVIVNIITQLFLQFLLGILGILYIFKFLILEVLVILIEYFLYRKISYKNGDKIPKKLLIYVLLANVVTSALTFFI